MLNLPESRGEVYPDPRKYMIAAIIDISKILSTQLKPKVVKCPRKHIAYFLYAVLYNAVLY